MPLSRTQTRELLETLGHTPRKLLGQNFLIDGNIVRKSIEMAGVTPGTRAVEVGPGLGTLTSALLEAGAEVWAVEHDRTLAKHLREVLLPAYPERLHLVEADALDEPLARLPADRVAQGYKIVANLPYAISTPWMDAVLSGPLPECMVLMLQKEAGDRYAAKHGSKTFGAISIFLQSAFEVTGRHLVSSQCFHPEPKVGSVLLRLERKPEPVRFSVPARDLVRRIFTQRRKQLGSLCRKDPDPRAQEWFNDLVAQGISPSVRPEDLPLPHWTGLAGI